MKCDKCQNKAYCDEHVGIRRICKRNGYNGFVMYTNADRIRAMTDEELAAWIETHSCPVSVCNERLEDDLVDCHNCWLSWLKSPVDGVSNDA